MIVPPDDLTRVPPNDLEAEMVVLGSILIDGATMDRLPVDLRPADFYRTANAQVFEVMCAIHERGDPVDVSLVRRECERQGVLEAIGEDCLPRLASAVSSPAQAKRDAEVVLDCSRRRTIIRATTRAQIAAYDGDDHAIELLRRAAQVCNGAEAGVRGRIRNGLGVAELIQGENLGETEYVISPLVMAEGISLISGLPKAGKTAFILWLVLCALRGMDPLPGLITLGSRPPRKVLILGEMSVTQTKRYIRLFDPQFELAGKVSIFNPSELGEFSSPEELRDALLALVQRDGYDLVIIDTLIRWSLTSQGESLNEQTVAARTFSAFREVTDATGASICLAAHSRKDSDKGRDTDMNAIAGSVTIRASTDVNTVLRLVDPDTTVVQAMVERRDVELMGYLADRARAFANGEPPPVRASSMRSKFFLRLDRDDLGRVRYVEAEADLAPNGGGPKSRSPADADVQARVMEALVSLCEEELRRAATERDELGPVFCFAIRKVADRVLTLWTGSDGSCPGRPLVTDALDLMARTSDEVKRYKQGEYPNRGRAGGYGLTSYVVRSADNGSCPRQGGGS